MNKIDRPGAAYVRVLTAISEHLTQSVVPMVSVHDLGTRNAYAKPSGATDLGFADILADVLAAHDDELLGAYVDDETAVLVSTSFWCIRCSSARRSRVPAWTR